MPKYTTHDGTRLAYRARGKGGPALVFVHGWCSQASHWEAQLRYFARHGRVLALDRRGHGQSDAPEAGYTAAQHAEDLVDIARKERIRSAILVGHAGGVPGNPRIQPSEPRRASGDSS